MRNVICLVNLKSRRRWRRCASCSWSVARRCLASRSCSSRELALLRNSPGSTAKHPWVYQATTLGLPREGTCPNAPRHVPLPPEGTCPDTPGARALHPLGHVPKSI
jgi:hypothetical protein